jgi:hypothetical protein
MYDLDEVCVFNECVCVCLMSVCVCLLLFGT